MSSIIRFTATKLNILQKQGVIKPESDGYYPMVLGALNSLNSAGEYYMLDGAKQLFDSSSILMRRIKNGNLKGEVGHPKKMPGMSRDDYLNRILRVEETNICSHFKEIWLDEAYGKNHPKTNNPRLVAIMGLVKPSGARGDVLAEALENKAENVCFSIRALTEDHFIRGVNHRILRSVLTWDWVTEPGISIATKWDAPALETIDSTFITRREIENAFHLPEGVSMESQDLFSQEALHVFDHSAKQKLPHYTRW